MPKPCSLELRERVVEAAETASLIPALQQTSVIGVPSSDWRRMNGSGAA